MKAHDLRPDAQHEMAEVRQRRAGRNARERAEKVIKVNRAHSRLHLPVDLDRRPLGGRTRVYRADATGTQGVGGTSGWKQPGRRFGPMPLGPDKPKVNKLTDSNGNPRIVPLDYDQRVDNYLAQPGQQGRCGTVTRAQVRRLTHKRNHAMAPFDPKDFQW